jgi:hypothetical protein
LEVCVLGPTEDLGDFANALRVLTRRAYGHVYRPPQVEERAGEAFVKGLTGTLKQRVREVFAENLDAALQLARNLVGISCLDKAVAPVAPTTSGSRPGGGAPWTPRGPGPRPMASAQGSQGLRPSGGSSQGSGAQPKEEMVCWYCGHKGHSKAECRKKAAAATAAKNGPSKNGREPGSYRPPESQ